LFCCSDSVIVNYRLYQRQEVLLQRQEAERLTIEEQFNAQLKVKDEDIRVLKTRLKKYRELQEEEHKSFLQQQQRINKLAEQLESAKKRLQCLGADPNFSEVAAKESLQQKNEAIAALEKENKILKKALEVEQRSKAIAKKLKDGGKDGGVVEELRLQLESANASLELAKQENLSLESRLLLLESKNPASNQSSRQTSAVAPSKRIKDFQQADGTSALFFCLCAPHHLLQGSPQLCLHAMLHILEERITLRISIRAHSLFARQAAHCPLRPAHKYMLRG
jgi:hypothetical protein